MYRVSLCLVLAAAIAAVSGYVPGREYEYKYHGYMISGFPDKKPQYAGATYDTIIRLQPHADDSILIMIIDTESKFSVFNKEVEDPSNHGEEYKHLHDHMPHIHQPYKAYFKNGHITHFEVAKNETLMSVNVKRSLLTMLNLHLDEAEGPESPERDNESYQTDYQPHHYRVNEDTFMGECETGYAIAHHPYHETPHNNLVLNITKAINYHKCKSIPNHYYSTFYGHECGEAEYEKAHTLHANNYYHYDIRGDRHNFIIERVLHEGETTYTPYPLDGQTMEVAVNRTIWLVEEREHPIKEFKMPDEVDTYYSLQYEIPFEHEFMAEIDMKKPHYLFDIYGRKATIEEIAEEVDHLLISYDDDTYHKNAKDHDHPAEFLELVRAFSTLDYEDIDTLYKRYADFPEEGATEQQLSQRSLFFDTLVNTGTNPAVEYSKDLIHNKQVCHEVALYIIQELQHHVKEVTNTLLEEVHQLCEDDYVKEDEHLHAACYITLSSIIHDHCVARYHPKHLHKTDKYACPADIPTKYFKYIAEHLDDGKHLDEYMKIAYLKAAGILGVKEAIPYIRHFIEEHGHDDNYLRMTSVWAAKNIGFRYPYLVRQLLVPVYNNHSESHEIRIAAFVVLMGCRPEMFVYETIARSLVEETDEQVRSFVYSSLREQANSTHPCDRSSSRNARYALFILKHYHADFDHYDYSYSHTHYSGGYNEHYDYGGSTRFSHIASDTGYIPRSAFLAFNNFFGGKSYNTFGVGFYQRGLEKFFDTLFGPEGAYGHKSMFDLLKVVSRKARDVSDVDKELKELHDKLHLKTKDYEHIHGHVLTTFMGNPHTFFYFNDSTFKNFFREGQFHIPPFPDTYHGQLQRFMLQVDKMQHMPNELGLPLFRDFKQPAYYYHKFNKLQVKVNPALLKEQRGYEPPTDVEIHVDGHIIYDQELFASLGTQMVFEHRMFGAGINRRVTVSLPLKFNAGVDLKEAKLTTQWTPIDHQIFHFDYEPYTFIDSYDNHLPVQDELSYLPVRRIGYGQKIEKHLFEDALGIGLKVEKNFDSEWNDCASWFRFFTQKSFRDQIYYLHTNPQFEPYHYNLYIEAAHENPTTEVDAEFSYSYYNDDHPHNDHKDSGFEEYDHTAAGQNLLTSVVRGEIVAKGPKERKVDAEISYTRDLGRFYHQINVYYDRTPFSRSENEHFKVCMSGYMQYPDIDLAKFELMDTIGENRTAVGKTKIHFGRDCSTDSKITISSKTEQSDEQKELESHREDQDSTEHYNPYSHLYHQCKHDMKENIRFSQACLDYYFLALEDRKCTHHIEYENIHPHFKNFTQKVARFFRHLLYDYSDHNEIDVHNPEGQIHFESNVSVHYPVADIRVSTPSRDSHYDHIFIPHYTPLSAYPYYQDFHAIKAAHLHYCEIEGNEVHTFDRYTYTLPKIDCYKVVAKDCSPNEHFVLLSSKIEHPKYAEDMKLYLGHHKIEALPLSDDSGLITRIDGQEVTITEGHPYYQYDGENHRDPVFTIQKRGYYYALVSVKYGLVVEYDGAFLAVQVSPFYRAKMCGLCGNYNGQKYDGYENEEGCIMHDDEEYAYSFAISSDTCHVPASEHKCYSEGTVGCTELKTNVIKGKVGERDETCFSTDPVQHCRSGCTAKERVMRKVSHHCLPSEAETTKNFLKASETRVLHEFHRKSHDIEPEVEVEEGCHR